MPKNLSAWEIAQTLEPIHWLENKETISSQEYQEKIKHRANLLLDLIEKDLNQQINHCSVLEIGGGATPMVDFLNCHEKINLDPLANFFMAQFPFLKKRDASYIQGKMEELPFKDNTFDLVICRNAIDHVEDADKCVKEVERVLKDGGIFYLAINTFSGLLYWYKLINKDKEHPYTFNIKSFKNLIEKNAKYNFNLKIKSCVIDSEDHKHFEEMESKTWWKVLLRKMFLKMNSYHFVELIIKKND